MLSRSAKGVSGLVGLGLLASSTTVALAGPPPAAFEALEGESLVDDRLSLLNGPKGCWEVEGDAMYAWESTATGTTRGTHHFVGKLTGGAWHDVASWSLGDTEIGVRGETTTVYAHGERRFQPLLARWEGDDGDLPNRIAPLIAGLGRDLRGKAVANELTWDDARDAALLRLVQPFGDGRNASTTSVVARYPNGGNAADWVVASIKGPISYNDASTVRIDRAHVELYGRLVEGQPFPNGEVVRIDLTIGRDHLRIDQSIAYRSIRPCGLPTEREAKPLSADAATSSSKPTTK